MASPRISILVPTLHEEANIEPLAERIFASAPPDTELIVIDDGSTDGTRERVLSLAEKYPIHLVARDAPSGGLAGAVMAGAAAASGEFIVVMDADLSHPPEKVPALLAPMLAGEADVVIGSRYAPGGSTPGWPRRRRLASRVAALLARPLTEAHDSLSGFFATTRERLLALSEDAAGFKICLELLVSGGDPLRVAEIPITFRDRERGESKMAAGVIVTYLRRLLVIAGGGKTVRAGWPRLLCAEAAAAVLDFLVFLTLVAGAAVSPGSAHVASFALASVAGYIAARRGTVVRFAFTALLALFLRGGVLALFHESWSAPPWLAILPAIAASWLVLLLGHALFLAPAGRHYAPGIRWRLGSVALIAYMVALRLVYLNIPDLIPEEAYYWKYAQHLAPGYLDHPPMVAWLIHLGTLLFGDTAFGVRIGAFLAWIAATLFSFRLTRSLYDEATALRAAALMQALPFFFTIGLVTTPDAPLTACWAGALYFFHRALLRGQAAAWLGVGVCMGLGMLSKYTISLLAPAALLFILLDKPSRRWLWHPAPWAGALMATALFTPVLYWNATHEWASFAFQGSRRVSASPKFSLHLLALSIVALLTPTGVAAAWVALRHPPDRTDPSSDPARRALFARVFTLVPLSVFFVFSLTHRVQLNWTGPAWLALLPAIAAGMVALPGAGHRLARLVRRAWVPTLLLLVAGYGALLHYLALGLPGVGYLPETQLIPVGWRELATQIDDLEEQLAYETGEEPVVIGMDKYFTASQLTFYDDDPADRTSENTGPHLFGAKALMYEVWFPPATFEGRPAILVSFDEHSLRNKKIPRHLDHLGPIRRGVIRRDGKFVREYFYRVGHEYRSKRRD